VKGIVATAIFFLGLALGGSPARSEIFPGNSTQLASPSGRLSIAWQEASDDAPHKLFLRTREGAELPILTFARHASVLWCPNSRAFAVSLSEESNSSRVVVYAVSARGELKTLRLIYPADVASALAESDHAYVDLRAWTAKGLLLHTWGYLPKSFSRNLLCSMDDQLRLTCR